MRLYIADVVFVTVEGKPGQQPTWTPYICHLKSKLQEHTCAKDLKYEGGHDELLADVYREMIALAERELSRLGEEADVR